MLCGTGEKARILIVEDDHDLANIISEVFARDGITVQTAHSLKETIKACSTFQPHLMLLDIGLPDGDGFNVVDWLRQHNGLARLPLVVYSGRDLTQEERNQLTLGPTYFLAKTRVQPQQLEALVLTMLRSSRTTEEAALPRIGSTEYINCFCRLTFIGNAADNLKMNGRKFPSGPQDSDHR